MVTPRDVLGNFHPRNVVFDANCDVKTGKLLAQASKNGVLGLDNVIDFYLRSVLQHLTSTYPKMAVQRESELFQIAMVLQRPPEDEVISYNMLVAGRYRDGFTYLQTHWSRMEFAYINGDAGILIHSGIRAGANSNYESAAWSFREAYAHAHVGYYLPEAIYLLGVARAAEGKHGLARQTWCFGLPRADPDISMSVTGVYQNYMMLGQLLSKPIPQE